MNKKTIANIATVLEKVALEDTVKPPAKKPIAPPATAQQAPAAPTAQQAPAPAVRPPPAPVQQPNMSNTSSAVAPVDQEDARMINTVRSAMPRRTGWAQQQNNARYSLTPTADRAAAYAAKYKAVVGLDSKVVGKGKGQAALNATAAKPSVVAPITNPKDAQKAVYTGRAETDNSNFKDRTGLTSDQYQAAGPLQQAWADTKAGPVELLYQGTVGHPVRAGEQLAKWWYGAGDYDPNSQTQLAPQRQVVNGVVAGVKQALNPVVGPSANPTKAVADLQAQRIPQMIGAVRQTQKDQARVAASGTPVDKYQRPVLNTAMQRLQEEQAKLNAARGINPVAQATQFIPSLGMSVNRLMAQ